MTLIAASSAALRTRAHAARFDERDSNILRDVRAKIKTVADGYDIAPEYVVRVLLAAMEKKAP